MNLVASLSLNALLASASGTPVSSEAGDPVGSHGSISGSGHESSPEISYCTMKRWKGNCCKEVVSPEVCRTCALPFYSSSAKPRALKLVLTRDL